jgi:VIT1/CCC1 family predicted Fe2+/Mn2+ transporter
MNDFMNYFFGPLPREYCLYYYFLAIISAVLLVITVLSFVFTVFKSKKIKPGMWFAMMHVLITLFISYFVSRLMYTICIKAL